MIEVMFTYHECGIKKAKARVRYRRENEKVTDWVSNAVAGAVRSMHIILSPLCRETKADIYLPFKKGQNAGIGMEPPT